MLDIHQHLLQDLVDDAGLQLFGNGAFDNLLDHTQSLLVGGQFLEVEDDFIENVLALLFLEVLDDRGDHMVARVVH